MRHVLMPLLATMLLATSAVARQQSVPAVTIPSPRQYELHSAINGRDYRLFVSLPQGYAASDTMRYPVLYVLDGNDSFPLAVETHRFLRIFAEVPEVIIVGVGYDARFFMDTFSPRWTDYTPSRNDSGRRDLRQADLEEHKILEEFVMTLRDGRTTSWS